MIKTAIAYTLGCLLLFQFDTLPTADPLWLLLAALLLLPCRHTRWFAIALFAFTVTLIHSQYRLNDRLHDDFIAETITLQGRIVTIPDYQARSVRFLFAPEQADLPSRIRLTWYHPFPDTLTIGQHWQFTVKLKPPYGMANPGGFDYEKWLFQQGIGATGYIKNTANNVLLAHDSTHLLSSWRQTILKSLETQLENHQQLGLITALLTGIKHDISDQQWQVLTATGTNHLLAISGLHIGIAAAIGFFLFRAIWSIRANNVLIMPAQHIGAIASIITATLYAGLAGFAIPTQRALIMVIVLMLSQLVAKPAPHSHRLAIAAILILILDPFAVLSPGFYLSFFAVAIILFVTQHRYPPPRWHWLRLHLMITLGLAPILLLFFGQFSIIAPIANVFAVPFVSLLIIPLLFLALFFLWLSPTIATALFTFADNLLSYFMQGLTLLSQLPSAQWHNAGYSPIAIVLVSITIIIVLLPPKLPMKWLAYLGLAPLFFASSHPNLAPGQFKLTLLDVGQGLSAVVDTQHHRLVYDAGARFGSGFDAGKDIVLPYLQQQSSSHIDTLVISHSDNDHRGGAQALITGTTIDTLLTSQTDTLPASQPCIAGQSWVWDDVTFTMLNPVELGNGSDNNLSCVIHIQGAFHRLLFTGDIEYDVEQQLIQRYGQQLQSDVMIAPHHGSKTSSSSRFIDTVNPQLVLFPVGYLNRYHFPAATILERYQQRGITTYSTARHGALTFFSQSEDPIVITRQRQDHQKIWTTILTE